MLSDVIESRYDLVEAHSEWKGRNRFIEVENKENSSWCKGCDTNTFRIVTGNVNALRAIPRGWRSQKRILAVQVCKLKKNNL